jgi:hypothetical protein
MLDITFFVGESPDIPRAGWNPAGETGFRGYLIEITADIWVRKLDSGATWKRMKTPS